MRSVNVASLALAFFLCTASATMVSAESEPPVPTGPVDKNAPPDNGGYVGHTTRKITVVKGWNNFHAYTCSYYWNDAGKAVLRVIGTNDESFFLETMIAEKVLLLVPHCAAGNWVSFYVTKVTSKGFTWTSVQGWSYK